MEYENLSRNIERELKRFILNFIHLSSSHRGISGFSNQNSTCENSFYRTSMKIEVASIFLPLLRDLDSVHNPEISD